MYKIPMQTVMGSNLHPSYSVSDWNLAGACNQNAMEQQFKLIPSALVSGCCCSQWAGVQHWHARTDGGGQCFQTGFQTQIGKFRLPATSLCTSHRTVHTEWCSAWSFPVFIYPLLFIPFYLSPSEAHVTPLLSGIFLRNKFIWLNSRSFLNNFRCFTES